MINLLHFHSLSCYVPWERGRRKKLGVKLGPGRRESWEEGIFKILLHFSLSYLHSFGNKLILPKSSLVSDVRK